MIFRISFFKTSSSLCIFKFGQLFRENVSYLGSFLNSLIFGNEAGLFCVSRVFCIASGVRDDSSGWGEGNPPPPQCCEERRSFGNFQDAIRYQGMVTQ